MPSAPREPRADRSLPRAHRRHGCLCPRPQIAAAIRADGRLEEAVNDRYDSWNHGVGKDIENGTANFESLESYMLTKGEISDNKSGRQEYLENLINEYI